MRSLHFTLLIPMLSALPAFSAQTVNLPPMPNLAGNASFEDKAKTGNLPALWRGDPTVFARDESVAHTGTASLRCKNDDPAKYRLCSTKVKLEAGRMYEFSVWVKTKDVKGDDSGATICVEWSDAKGKWLGGAYPRGIKGTKDWTLVTGTTRRIPRQAKGFSLTCYLRKHMTGAAWFDDVHIRRTAAPIFQTALVQPAYRGWIRPGDKGKVVVRANLSLDDYDMKLADVALRAELIPAAGGAPLRKVTAPKITDDSLAIEIAASDLPEGKLTVRVSLLRRSDHAVLATNEHAVQRVADDFEPKCYIDAHRRVILDGKPFFPLGMYWSGINEADLRVYADSPFNCLMPYGSPNKAQLDLAQQLGLKVIYSIKDYYAGSHYCPKLIKTEADEEPAVRKRVRLYRDHPALLAWYLNDELPLSYLPRLEAHQRWVEEQDPNHPTWVVLCNLGTVGPFIKSYDVIGTDPYPIPKRPASMAADWTRETVAGAAGSRAVWMVPQIFNWANYRKTEAEKKALRPPTFDEMRSMTWQCIAEGATGLVYYSFFDIKRGKVIPFEKRWAECKKIGREVEAMIPVLLSIEPAPKVEAKAGEWLHFTVRRLEGKVYIIAANDGDGEGAAAFRLPFTPRSVTVVNEDRAIAPAGAAFSDRFDKLAVHIYEVR